MPHYKSTSECPLITPYTDQEGIPHSILDKMWAIRRHDPADGPIGINIGPWIRQSTAPKNFQTQAIALLSIMPRMILTDAVGLGKTLESIAGMCYLKHRNPKLKVLVVTTKSVAPQFRNEIEKFSHLNAVVAKDNYKGKTGHDARLLQMKDWLGNPDTHVLCTRYSALLGQRRKATNGVDDEGNPAANDGKEVLSKETRDIIRLLRGYNSDDLLIVFDECHKLKNPEAQTRTSCMQYQKYAGRVWGLSASLASNGADEVYAVMSALGIRPFHSLRAFYENYCVFRLVTFGRRTVKKLQSYKNMKDFKRNIRPFIFGRSQLQVNEPLPRLSTQFYDLDLDKKQKRLLLQDIPSGKYLLPPAVIKMAGGGERIRERDTDNMMTMLSVYSLVANNPALLEVEESKINNASISPKEEAMFDLLEGDLAGEHVVVFTKYKKFINRLQYLVEKKGHSGRKFLRITGDENPDQREEAKRLFQDPESGYNLIVINSAGIEGINLQSAGHMICLDLPWSWGSMLQLVGRILRIASPHSACTLHTLVSKGTPDEYVIEALKSKKKVFEVLFGSSHSTGLLESEVDEIDIEGSIDRDMSDSEFRTILCAHAKSSNLGQYLSGYQLTVADDQGDNYVPEYSQETKKRGRKSKREEERIDLDTISF